VNKVYKKKQETRNKVEAIILYFLGIMRFLGRPRLATGTLGKRNFVSMLMAKSGALPILINKNLTKRRVAWGRVGFNLVFFLFLVTATGRILMDKIKPVKYQT